MSALQDRDMNFMDDDGMDFMDDDSMDVTLEIDDNNMSDDKIMTKATTNARSRKPVHSNNNGTQGRLNGANRSTVAMKSRSAANTTTTSDASNGKENVQTGSQPPSSQLQCKTSESVMTLQTSASEDTIRTEGGLPLNGHTRISIDRDKKFIKQQSEASSSGATAELNMNESMLTNESSLANKSFVTSISVGGHTDKSTGADSTTSAKSNVSTSEIKAEGVELICKFYAKRPGDKKPCLLRDVAITENGEVLITDSKNRNIKVFDLEGEYISTISHPDLRDPFGIACMRDGKFIVSDCKSRDLKIFNIDGSLIDKVGRNLDDYPMKSPRGVALNSKGEIVVSDSSRKCVYVYPIEGAFCEIIWGEAGLKPLQFKNPSYVSVTLDDDIIVSDYFSKKIAVFDAHTHDLKFTYGNKEHDKKLSYPRGVAIDLEGNLLIADNYNGKIHHVDTEEGTFIQFAYGDKHSVHRIRSVACDALGHMVVLENGGRVKIFDISQMHAKPPVEEEPEEEPEKEQHHQQQDSEGQ